jgi:hypothetical protein
MFENNSAIDNRFLKVMLEGVLEEDFKINFNITKVAEENKMYYIKLAKHLLWLMQERQNNNLHKRFKVNDSILTLKGRRKDVFENIDIILHQFAKDNVQYNQWHSALEQGVINYKAMFNTCSNTLNYTEETIN